MISKRASKTPSETSHESNVSWTTAGLRDLIYDMVHDEHRFDASGHAVTVTAENPVDAG